MKLQWAEQAIEQRKQARRSDRLFEHFSEPLVCADIVAQRRSGKSTTGLARDDRLSSRA